LTVNSYLHVELYIQLNWTWSNNNCIDN